MAWCEREQVGYVVGLAGNKVLLRRVADLAEETALRRIEGEAGKPRRYDEFRYAAKTWEVERRASARVEASERRTARPSGATHPAGPPPRLVQTAQLPRARADNQGERSEEP